jgi:hypothetical protein
MYRRPKRWKRKILKRILREKRMCLIKKLRIRRAQYWMDIKNTVFKEVLTP